MAEYFWDRMYDTERYRYGKDPNAFLAQVASDHLSAGASALCIGDGEGRNGVWLAGQGLEVTMVEPSVVGARKARAFASERGVEARIIEEFFPTDALGDALFDAVALIYIHVPEDTLGEIYRAAAARLAPGGLLVVEGFHPDQVANARPSGGPRDTSMLLTAERLRRELIDHDETSLELVSLEEVTVELKEGRGHSGPADVVRMIARRV